MKKIKYLFRVDDVCRDMDKNKFKKLIFLFNKYKIKPTLAIIPNNQDPSIKSRKNSYNKKSFTNLIKRLAGEGYYMGLHGFNHELNKNYSEFKGIPLEIQRLKIKKGKLKLRNLYGIKTKIFIAPAHTFDKNTLKILREEKFKINYDGNSINPYIRKGLINIPSNLNLKIMHFLYGINTICIHPNKLSKEDFLKIEKFIIKNRKRIGEIKNIVRSLKSKSSKRISDLLGILFIIIRIFNDLRFRLNLLLKYNFKHENKK